MVKLIVLLAYVMVTLICVGVSVWSSYNGFIILLGSLALPVSISLGLMLFAGDMVLQQAREYGRPLGAILAFMVLPFIASFASNYNYFYTNAMRERVASDQLDVAHQQFDEMMQAANLALRQTSSDQNRRKVADQVNEQMRALRDQIADPLNPGLGTEAIEHVNEIYDLLPNLTDLQLPSNPKNEEQVDTYVANLQRIIDRELATMQNSSSIQSALDKVKGAQERARSTFDTARILPLAAWEPKVTAVASIAQEFRDTMPFVNSALKENGAPTIEGVRPLDEQDVLLGEIAYSFKNGFQEGPSPGTTLLSSAAAIGIDLMPILFALALFHRRREEDEDI